MGLVFSGPSNVRNGYPRSIVANMHAKKLICNKKNNLSNNHLRQTTGTSERIKNGQIMTFIAKWNAKFLAN